MEGIEDESGIPFSDEPGEVVKSAWFNPLAKTIGEWYRQRYGKAGSQQPICSERVRSDPKDPFLLEIPTLLMEPGEEKGYGVVSPDRQGP
jgi:hypothetical protein